MAQGDYNIQNQGFPAFRSDLNSTLEAINTSNSGTSRPSSAVAGTVWLDTTSATTPTLKFYDGADDISLATLDYTANTVNWLDSSVSLDIVSDTTPQLGGDLDVNGNDIVSVSNGDITFTPDGTGKVIIDGLSYPTADGTNGQALITNGSGILSFGDVSGAIPYGLFSKIDPTVVAWNKTGAFTLTTNTGLYIEVNGDIKTISSGTSITMPGSATSGTDYAIWCTTAGALEATTDHVSPPSANARKVGGFHYAPGENATGTSGGNTTPSINVYSLWDLKWRPNCSDPRGMTLIGGHFWSDIYLTGVDHHTNGTSKYNVTIADSSSPPKVPSLYGGNGSTTYGSYTWWECAELLSSHGKRPPTYQEFSALAYGTTEASSRGSDPVTTQMSATDDNFTSKWGVIQSTGCLRIWGNHFGGPYGPSANTANTEGRGSTYNLSNAVFLGGRWLDTSNSGSRSSDWSYAPTFSNPDLGSRGVCDHKTNE